jgi:hypothetical protein
MLPRAQTCLEPERYSGGEGDAGEEVGGEFVVAGVDAAEVLEAAEGVLDEVTAAMTFLVIADGALAAAPAGDDGNGRQRRGASAAAGLVAIRIRHIMEYLWKPAGNGSFTGH